MWCVFRKLCLVGREFGTLVGSMQNSEVPGYTLEFDPKRPGLGTRGSCSEGEFDRVCTLTHPGTYPSMIKTIRLSTLVAF